MVSAKPFHSVQLVRSGVWRGMAWSGRQSVGELDWITGCACLTHRRSIIPKPTLYAHICHLICHAHRMLTICHIVYSIYAHIYPFTMQCTSNAHYVCPYMPIYCAVHIPCPQCLSTMPIYAHLMCSAVCMSI